MLRYIMLGLIQGPVVRWSLNGQSFPLANEGVWLLEVYNGLLTAHPADAIDGESVYEIGTCDFGCFRP